MNFFDCIGGVLGVWLSLLTTRVVIFWGAGIVWEWVTFGVVGVIVVLFFGGGTRF